MLQKISEPKVHTIWKELMIATKYLEPKLIALNITWNTTLEETGAFTCEGYAKRNVMIRLGWRVKCQRDILRCENICQSAALQTSLGAKKNSRYNDVLFTSDSPAEFVCDFTFRTRRPTVVTGASKAWNARTVGLWVRVQLEAWMSVCVSSVFMLSWVGSGLGHPSTETY
jgi:hypothetical protein